jgi:hypothetical protein
MMGQENPVLLGQMALPDENDHPIPEYDPWRSLDLWQEIKTFNPFVTGILAFIVSTAVVLIARTI